MSKSVIGDSPRRREDARFITGRGAYIDDLKFENLARAVFLRAPHAHALIRSIDTRAAKAAQAVAVLTAADAAVDGLKSLRPYAEANVQTGERFIFDEQPLLAADKVRFTGETVAMVVAETLTQALDAAELIAVDYEPLPAVTSAYAAAAPGAPQLSPEVPGNICMDWKVGDAAGAEAAFARAAHIVSLDLDNHRVTTNPIEPRGSVGTFDPANGRYTLHISSQSIHANRNHAARALGVEPKDFAIHRARCRRRLRRQELHLCRARAGRLGGAQGRSAGEVDRDTQRGLPRRPSVARHAGQGVDGARRRGQVPRTKGGQRRQCRRLSRGCRRRRADLSVRAPAGHGLSPASIALHVLVVLSNTTPIGVMRGPGFAETVNILERLIDAAALQAGFDRAELRRINMVPADEMPMTNAFGFQVDSGAFAQTMDKALERADLAGFEARRRQSEVRGLRRGLGFAYHIKGTGGAPEENVDIRFEPDGTVSLITGTQHIGQGHETTFPQILAHRLGVANEKIHLRQGDTDLIPYGGGHGSSRATYMGGTAMWRASDEIIQKGMALAADMLEASEADIRFEAEHATSWLGHRSRGRPARGGRTRPRERQAARHLSLLEARAPHLPQWHACRRGRGRSRDRPGDSRALLRS